MTVRLVIIYSYRCRNSALKQIVCVVGDINRTVSLDYIVDAMASENSQPWADRKGIDFRVHVQILWNAPESVVTLDSPGVIVLDTTCDPDVLGVRTRYADAETVRVMHGRARESVRVLIPDTNVADRGFDDVTLLDMAEAIGPAVHVGDSPATAVASFGTVWYVPETDRSRTVASHL